MMKLKIKFRSVKTRQVFWFLIVGLLPLIVISIVIYTQRVKFIKEEAFHKLMAIRDLKVEQVNSWLDARVGDIKTISEDSHLKALENTLKKDIRSQDDLDIILTARAHLNRYLKNHKDYLEIFIVNPISDVIEVSTDKSKESLDKSKDSYFTEPMRTRQLFIKGIYFSRTLNRPSMSFSIPLYCDSHNGEHIIGILVARIDLKPSLYALLLNRTGMGETGETLIVNKDVLALNELRWHDNAPLKLKIKANPALKASKGETGITEIEDYRNEKVLAAYTYIHRTKWGFVAKQDLKEVYAPIRSLLWNIVILFLLSAMVIYMISILLSKSITRPVDEMTKASKKIQEGDYSVRNQIRTADEFGYLAETFNHMAESISSQISIIKEVENELRIERDSLEEQVQERTLSLQKELDERKKAEEALRESEERYSALFDRSLDCVFVNTPDGDFIDANSAALNLLGYKREDIRSLNYASLLSEEQLPMAFKALEEIVETDSQKELLELKLRRKDGKSVYVETKGSLIYRDGKPYAVQGIARDITDRREAERDRERLLAELEAKNKELESFVYSITHDLKTPLVSLQGFSSLLQRQLHDQLDEEGKHYMERIQDNVAHMDSLISDLLELSRIGRVVGPMEEIDVATLLKEIQQDLAIELEEAGAELVAQEPLPVVHADPGRIRQIFTNLIDNALKFRSRDRPLRIEVGCKEERGSYRIHVADNGIGIAPQYQEQIFNPFRKLDPKTEGMGIGLALVQKIVESHGGRVWIESPSTLLRSPTEAAEGQVGGGATFYLTLPRREES